METSPLQKDVLKECSEIESEFYVESRRYIEAGKVLRTCFEREERIQALTDRFRLSKAIDLILDDYNALRGLNVRLES